MKKRRRKLFLENVKQAATQVSILYIMIAIGFVCDKAKLFTEKAARMLVDFLLYIVVPCMLVRSFTKIELTRHNLLMFLLSLLLAFTTHFIAIALNLPFFRKKNDENPIYKYASIYGNVGFMALPLASEILGNEGVFYCANGVIAFNIITFIHGVKIMNRDGFKLNLKNLVLNPGIISVIIGLPLFLLQVKLPVLIEQPMSYLAELNTPLAMLIFGTYLANTDLKTMFTDKKIYLAAFLKLLAMPLLCIGIYHICGVSGTLLVACAITACVPSANNTFMFASKYGRDTGLASKTVALVSLFSIITMPVVIAIAQSI